MLPFILTLSSILRYFLNPWKMPENPKVFWRFWGVQKMLQNAGRCQNKREHWYKMVHVIVTGISGLIYYIIYRGNCRNIRGNSVKNRLSENRFPVCMLLEKPPSSFLHIKLSFVIIVKGLKYLQTFSLSNDFKWVNFRQ